ncbi:MAG: hypothetical protein ACI959_000908, partial [Limisphaerales bacterium]
MRKHSQYLIANRLAGKLVRRTALWMTLIGLFASQSLCAQVSANNDFVSLSEDGTILASVQDNDDNFGTPPLTTTIVSGPVHGAATVIGFTAISYTPELNFAGTDTVEYEVCNADLPTPSCDQALLILTVFPQNDQPEAFDDSYTVPSDATSSLDVQFNDIDIDGDALETFVIMPSLNGTAVAPMLDSVFYTPDMGFLGIDSFKYRVCDDDGFCDDAIVRISVLSGNA